MEVAAGVVDDDRETLIGDTLVKIHRIGKTRQHVSINRTADAVARHRDRRESRVQHRHKSPLKNRES
jgi:hypothetical protein